MGARAAVAELTGLDARSARSISGDVHVVALADGGRVVAKESGSALAEAASLRWLAVPGGPPVPRVLGQRGTWLVTDFVPTGSPGREAAEAFGRELAVLHGAGAPRFGSPPPDGPVEAAIGLAPMRDATGERWPEWYLEHRVEPYLRTAVDRGLLTEGEARLVTAKAERADDPGEPPARLHGDLWAGNVLWAADGRAWLIDPAAHGGHRETDLAMLHLFGCPHLDRVLDGYRQVTPLADGWADRIGLHQLFPLLVHVVLFGRSYAPQLVAAAR
ncbi:fructosamine kinase family protein [Umezawaea sp. NPDC059074]|uniref:fructosamine kinase family protein n=1 Tax=Umezawaea sp. NPDC059074 TaxID=3346716 RepID=UPI0036CD8D16